MKSWRLTDGEELTNEALSEALLRERKQTLSRTTREFTQEEWDAFGVHGLHHDHYILSGGEYFEPFDARGWDAFDDCRFRTWFPGVVNARAVAEDCSTIASLLEYRAPPEYWESYDNESSGYFYDNGAHRIIALDVVAASGEAVAQHLDAIIRLRRDEQGAVVAAADAVLAKWPGVVARPLAQKLEKNADAKMRQEALGALGATASAEAVAQHHEAIAKCLEDSDPGVCHAALKALAVSAEAAAQHHEAVAKRLEDAEGVVVRQAALEALAGSAEAVAQQHEAIANCLEDDNAGVRHAALKALAVSADAVAQHHKAIAKRMEEAEEATNSWLVRQAAVKALARSAEAVTQHHEAIAMLLCDSNEAVRQATTALLVDNGCSTNDAVTQHRAAFERLRDNPKTHFHTKDRIMVLLASTATNASPARVPRPPDSLVRQLFVPPGQSHRSSTLAPPSANLPAAAEVESAAGRVVELDDIGYMALKRLVISAGVPQTEASAVMTKAGLKALAERHRCDLKLVWRKDVEVVSAT